MGAVLNNLVVAYRNRRQPIGFRVEVLPVFTGTLGTSSMAAALTITDGDHAVETDNLFLLEFQIVNRGNQDFSKFAAGFSLDVGEAALHIEAEAPTRHHGFSLTTELSPASPSRDFDFALAPFNRADLYTLRAYVVTTGGQVPTGNAKASSPEAVKFVGMPTLSELAAEAARDNSLRIGPIRIGFYG